MINYMSQRITKVLGLIAFTGLSGLISAQTMDWKPAGPVYNSGRARNMVVDKNNNKVLYVGSASSGVFKSIDEGKNWVALNDQGTVRNISYMAQDIGGTIYAGTGEGFLRAGQKAKAQPGTGLYKLNSSELLVQVVSSSVVGNIINRVACSPIAVSNIALATNLGIFVSTDGGTFFTQVNLPGAPTGTTVSGQDVKFDASGTLYCSIGAEAGTSTLTASKVYKSTNTSLTAFTTITPPKLTLPDDNYGRIELAIAPSNSNVIYASCANKYTSPSSATLKGLFVSYDGGTNWGLVLQGSAQLDPLSNTATIASGDYAHVITVSPTNPDVLYFGGYKFYLYVRTGGSNANPVGNWYEASQSVFVNSQTYLHQNIHDIKIIPGSPTKYYFITDAGVYRSIDLDSGTPTNFPSYQPFYKGMITGQFNSVSIERYPLGDSIPTNREGMKVTPYSGFIGGTGGNGLTYFSGTYSIATTELNYVAGEVYNAEYSKILPNSAYLSRGNGDLYRSTNVKNSDPTRLNINRYSGALSVISPAAETFTNPSYATSGTPFKTWEYYGQAGVASPDSAVFYNDTVRYQATMSGIPELTSKMTFTFSTSRPNQYAIIDSVVVRTGTVQLPINGTYANLQTPFNGPQDGQTIYARTTPTNFAASSTPTVLSSISVGASTVPVTFSLNPATLIDNFSVTFTAPPFGTKTITQYPATATGTAIIVPDAASYYRVFATVFYKYKANDVVGVVDNNISTRTTTYTANAPQDLSWRYGKFPATSISYTGTTTGVSSPTYVLVNSANSAILSQPNPTFNVSPFTATSYSIRQFGVYTLTAKPVSYTLEADPITYTLTATLNPSPTAIYTLMPGAITQTNNNVFIVAPINTTASVIYTITSGATSDTFAAIPQTSFSVNPSAGTQTTSVGNVFSITINPTVSTTYTLTQTTGTVTQDTQITIGSSTYVINPGSISKIDTLDLEATITAIGDSFTLTGLSSNTLAGANTTTVYTAGGNITVETKTAVTSFVVPLCANNPPVKTPKFQSARLAMILNHASHTNSNDAIVVSKNPLALNDPLSLVRVSQSGAYSDDASGNSTNNTITIDGKPTLLEWSPRGTEIYFATASNKLYRVSHITTIMDLSPSSYSGKFYTDIFKYGTNSITGSTPNPASPYRTTLIGSFDKPITSISVSNDNLHLAVTFNSQSTGTTSTVMYCSNDVTKSNSTNATWVPKQGSLPTGLATYCSLMEKGDDKIFFMGTENGLYYTTDITSASATQWKRLSNDTTKLPNVQIFDIKQQTLEAWDCYNSGQIYVATNGRGVWNTGKYFNAYTVDIEEYQKPIEGKNLSLYPNPTNGNVNVLFNSVDGETAVLQVMDISGRVVQSENLGRLDAGDTTYTFDTKDLKSGVYIVNIQSNSNVKRVTKLIVTK
jgi:hypothetical protein